MTSNSHAGGTATRAPRLAKGKSDSRSRLIGAIRAAAARKGMSDEHRRDLIERVTGKRSAGELSLPELGRVLDEMNRDWRARAAGNERNHIGKIKAMWWGLYWLGEVDDDRLSAINAFVERQTGIAALRFLDHKGSAAVVEALKAWQRRAGVQPPDPAMVAVIMSHTPSFTPALAERHRLLDAIWLRLERHGATMAVSWTNYVQRSLGLMPNHHLWGAHELDAAIRLLGRWLRDLRQGNPAP